MPSPYQRDVFRVLAEDRSWDFEVYYQQGGASDSPWDESKLEPWESILPGWGFEFGSRVRFQFNRFPLRLKGSDVIIVNCSLTSPSAQWLMRKGFRGKRWIFWGEKMRRSGRPVVKQLKQVLSAGLRGASAIAAVGEQAAAEYREHFPGMKVANIPYGCDLEPFHPSGKSVESPVILFCGQMIARKGVDVLLRAYEKLVDRGSSASLLLVGREGELPGWLQELKEETRAGIEWIGFVQPEELPVYFKQSTIFVLPSRYDGWGVVVNQALGAGLPIVCTSAVGCANELVIPDYNGFVIPPDDPETLALKLEILVEDESMRINFAANSLAMARDASAEAIAGRWKSLITEVAS